MGKPINANRRSTAEKTTPVSKTSELLQSFEHIRRTASASSDGHLCAVAPAPELKERIAKEIAEFRSKSNSVVGSLARAAEPNRPGFNDGLIFPPDMFPLGTPLSAIR